MLNNHPILYFDGICGLCNGFVDFVIRRDKEHRIYFASLQSGFAQRTLPQNYSKDLSSLVLKENDTIYTKSDAVFRVLFLLGGVWKFFSWLKFLPRFFRDGFYQFISKNRYRIFGRKESCRLPSNSEKEFFLE